MSMMRCDRCDRIEDTDDCTGLFEEKGTRFWCERCVEQSFEDRDETDCIMVAFKAQNPKEFQDTWDSYA